MSFNKRFLLGMFIVIIFMGGIFYYVGFSSNVHRKFIGSGTLWFFVARTIAYDPPGDNSFETNYFCTDDGGLKLYVVFLINSCDSLPVVSKLIDVRLESSSVGHRISRISNGFLDVFDYGKFAVWDYSSLVTNDSKFIGPTRIINSTLFSGNAFIGFRVTIEYKIYLVSVERFGRVVDRHYEFLFSIIRIVNVVTWLDLYVSSISTIKLYEVFDSAYLGKYGELFGSYKYRGKPINISVKYYSFCGRPLDVSFGELKIGQLSFSISIMQRIIFERTCTCRTNVTIFDDDPSDTYDVMIYWDPYYPTLLFVVENATTTNPNEFYLP